MVEVSIYIFSAAHRNVRASPCATAPPMPEGEQRRGALGLKRLALAGEQPTADEPAPRRDEARPEQHARVRHLALTPLVRGRRVREPR